MYPVLSALWRILCACANAGVMYVGYGGIWPSRDRGPRDPYMKYSHVPQHFPHKGLADLGDNWISGTCPLCTCVCACCDADFERK